MAVIIRRDIVRVEDAVDEGHQLRFGGGILRPGWHGWAVRIEVVDEVDKIVSDVASAVNIQDICGVELNRIISEVIGGPQRVYLRCRGKEST